MKNFLSILGGLSILTLSTISCTFAYTQEQQEAYQWAYKYGITTQPTIEAANLNGNVTRQAFSKMVVNYLEKVVGIKQTTSDSCSFPDESKITNDLKTYAKKTCAYNIMGTNGKIFNPTQPVDRAQLGTVLSRVLWGNEYNANGKQYYIYHLNALKQNGIMSNINNPQAYAKRGDVLIMLKRTYDKFGSNVSMNGNQNSAYNDTKTSTDNKVINNKTTNTVVINTKPDSNGFMYYDSYLDRPALSKAMKDMKLRSTSCSNIFCQQVGDDGTYSNQKHYYWNDDEGTMTLIPGVYYISDCAYYDSIYGKNNNYTTINDEYDDYTSTSYSNLNVIYTGKDGTKYYYDNDFLNMLKNEANKKGESDLTKYLEVESEYYVNGLTQLESLDLENLPEMLGIDEDIDPETMTQKEKEALIKKIKDGVNKIIKENKDKNNEYTNKLQKVTKNINNDKFGLKDKYKKTKGFIDATNSFLELYSETIFNLMETVLTSEDGELDDGEGMAIVFTIMGSALAYQGEAEEYQNYLEERAIKTIKLLGSDSSNSSKSSNTSNKSSETSNKSTTNSDTSWIDDVTKNWKGNIIKAEDLVSKKENKHSAYVKLEKRTLFIDEEYNYILKIGPEFVGYTMEVYYNDINEVAEIYMRSNSDDIWFQVRVNPREDCKYINFKYGNEYIWGANDERVFSRYSRYKNDWVELITNVKSGKSVDELDNQHNCKAQGY